MFEQAFRNIDDILFKDAGCTSELDYTEQSSWLLFLKYLDSLERDRATAAALEFKPYAYLLDADYRWESWAAPKGPDGKIDHKAVRIGDDLLDFVNGKLFPYLKGFRAKAESADTIEYKIGEIFAEIKNRIASGYNLRDVIDIVDTLRFGSGTEKHELSHLYEAKIRNMGNAGRNGGEYYTPRPLIRAMVRVVDPKVGERVYDGAVGSAGFLCEAFEYMKAKPGRTTDDDVTLQTRTFYGKEKKSLAYVIGIMNMILHGIDAPNIIHTNTLAENISDIQDKDRVQVVLANPPFGGKERPELQQNFPIKSGETAFLFLQHFIKMLKAGGRGGVVIKNTFLSNTDNASVSLRKLLLQSCDLHTVLDCPSGTFQGATVRTVVLFFVKGAPTRKIWCYQLDPGRSLGKSSPLNDADLAEFVEFQQTKRDSLRSWTAAIANDFGTLAQGYDLSLKNPNSAAPVAERGPAAIASEVTGLDGLAAGALSNVRAIAARHASAGQPWPDEPLSELVEFRRGLTYGKGDEVETSASVVLRANNIDLFTNLLDLTDLRFINDSVTIPVAKIVRPGSLMICTASGSKSHLGKVAYIDRDYGYAFGGFMGLLIAGPRLLPMYLFHLMTSQRYKDFIASLSDGANINNLKFDDLGKFPVPLPTLTEQARIVAVLDELRCETQSLDSLARLRATELDALKKSLLHQAFTGNL